MTTQPPSDKAYTTPNDSPSTNEQLTASNANTPMSVVPWGIGVLLVVLIVVLSTVACVMLTAATQFANFWFILAKTLSIYLIGIPAVFVTAALLWQKIDSSTHFALRNVVIFAWLVALSAILWLMGSYS